MDEKRYCVQCGAEIKEGQLFCGQCGVSVEQTQIGDMVTESETVQLPKMQFGQENIQISNCGSAHVKCPQCNSQHLTPIVETNTTGTTGSGYSGAAGCLGLLMFGPCGLLCGNCGQSAGTVSTTNKSYWVCQDCGNKFRNLNDFREEIDKEKKRVKTGKIVIIVFLVLCVVGVIPSLFEISIEVGLGVGLFYVVFLALIGFGGIYIMDNRIKKLEAEYTKLEEKSRV